MLTTDQMVEFQITQEYLGHSNHLAYLAPMWEEFFEDVRPETLKGVAGVANIGDSENFTAIRLREPIGMPSGVRPGILRSLRRRLSTSGCRLRWMAIARCRKRCARD